MAFQNYSLHHTVSGREGLDWCSSSVVNSPLLTLAPSLFLFLPLLLFLFLIIHCAFIA